MKTSDADVDFSHDAWNHHRCCRHGLVCRQHYWSENNSCEVRLLSCISWHGICKSIHDYYQWQDIISRLLLRLIENIHPWSLEFISRSSASSHPWMFAFNLEKNTMQALNDSLQKQADSDTGLWWLFFQRSLVWRILFRTWKASQETTEIHVLYDSVMTVIPETHVICISI